MQKISQFLNLHISFSLPNCKPVCVSNARHNVSYKIKLLSKILRNSHQTKYLWAFFLSFFLSFFMFHVSMLLSDSYHIAKQIGDHYKTRENRYSALLRIAHFTKKLVSLYMIHFVAWNYELLMRYTRSPEHLSAINTGQFFFHDNMFHRRLINL